MLVKIIETPADGRRFLIFVLCMLHTYMSVPECRMFKIFSIAYLYFRRRRLLWPPFSATKLQRRTFSSLKLHWRTFSLGVIHKLSSQFFLETLPPPSPMLHTILYISATFSFYRSKYLHPPPLERLRNVVKYFCCKLLYLHLDVTLKFKIGSLNFNLTLKLNPWVLI